MNGLDLFVSILSIIITVVGCTWKICDKLNTFVTKDECQRFREGICPRDK